MILSSTITHWSPLKAYKTLEKRFIGIHDNKYKYTQAIYKGSKIPIDIICPIHGIFKQLPSVHLMGKGCPLCGNLRTNKEKTIPFNIFKARANTVHNSKYKYLELSYKNMSSRVGVLCPIHGISYQFAFVHLRGNGCPKCGNIAMQTDWETITKRFVDVHGDKYNYINSKYEGYHNNIKIGCNICDTWFNQVPATHITGAGCPECRDNGGYRHTKPGLLYYLSVDNGKAYKIGITNRSVNERYNKIDKQKIQILHQVWYKDGTEALREEQRILKQYKEYRYTGPALLKDGNTELFSVNILNKGQ